MRFTALIWLALSPLLAINVQADGDVEAGKRQYAACAACHGAAAEGSPALQAPRLNHLRPVYVLAQLRNFRDGLRGGEPGTAAAQMVAMAATLPDEQAMLDVATYIASLSGGPSAATVEGDRDMGADYYNQFCGACHGPAAEGNVALHSPRLAGTDDWYLLAQLRAFREGSRGSHPEDRTGRQMRAMAGVLPGEQAARDVVAFIRSLEP
jgi:cytochrome c553